MKELLGLIATSLLLTSLAGCATTSGASGSQLDADLITIRSGYAQCVTDLGADSAQCKTLSDGIHQIADQVGSAQNTAGRMKAESDARRSMGY